MFPRPSAAREPLRQMSSMAPAHAAVWVLAAFTLTCAGDASTRIDAVSEGPGAEAFIEALQSIVDNADPPVTGAQTFYATRFHHDVEAFYLFWPQARRLWILDVRNETLEHWRSSLGYPRSGTMLDLDRDVVATEEDIGTSTYLVSRPWVAELLDDAVSHGDRFLIRPNPDNPRPPL